MTILRRLTCLITACLLVSAVLAACSSGPPLKSGDGPGSTEKYLKGFIGNSGSGLPALAVSVIKDGAVVYRVVLGTHRADDGHAIIVMTNRGDGRSGAMVERITRYLGQQFLGETMGR